MSHVAAKAAAVRVVARHDPSHNIGTAHLLLLAKERKRERKRERERERKRVSEGE